MEKHRRRNDDVEVLLSFDVWFEILRRIPAADLLPLKAVCKTFHRLISDDFFTRMHLNYFTKNLKAESVILISSRRFSDYLHHHNCYDPDERTISGWSTFKFPLNCYRVIDSYHGLCLVDIFPIRFLYNPITRLYKALPSIRSDLQVYNFWKIGYDDVSKQYKVFVLTCSESENRVLLHVFDVHRDVEFRETTAMELCPQRTLVSVKGSVLVNGNVYFLIITQESETLIGYTMVWRTRVVSANVTTEEVKIRSCSDMPPSTLYSDEYYFAANGTYYLVLCNNYLSLDLWVLEGVENENPNPRWMIKQIIDLSDQVNSITSMPEDIGYRVLGVFRTKVLIKIMIGRGRPRVEQLYQYDMISKEFEEVTVTSGGDKIIRGIIDCKFSRIIVEHTNSLISPDCLRKLGYI